MSSNNNNNSKWKVPLSSSQKSDLDRSIVEYIQWHLNNTTHATDNNSHDLIQSLNHLFQIQQSEGGEQLNKGGQLLLPRKWNSIVQLQRKIMLLEDNINQLNIQIDSLKESSSNSNSVNNETIQRWTPKSSPSSSFIVESPITAIKLHPSLPMVIIATNHGKLYVYDILNTALPIASMYAHTKAITSIQVAPLDDHRINIITASKDLFIRSWIWNSTRPARFELDKTLQDHDHIVSQIVAFPHHINNSSMLASCSRDSTIKIWNLTDGWCVRTIRNAHSEWIRSIDVLGAYILSAGHDTSVRLSHWPTGNGLSLGVGHTFPIERVLFLPLPAVHTDNEELDFNERMYRRMGFKYCFTAGRDNLIKMWQIPIPSFSTNDTPIPNVNPQSRQFTLHKEFKGHTSWVRDIKLSHLGPFLFSCSDDNTLKMWDIDSGECIKTWPNFHSGFVNCIDTDITSNDRNTRKLLVSGGIDCKCNILMN